MPMRKVSMAINSLPLSYWLGFALMLWLIYDLVMGHVYLHRDIDVESEPLSYWLVMLLWLAVAVSCFIYPQW